MANVLIHRFNASQEIRQLTLEEGWLRRTLKRTVLGLSSLERIVARQRSRLRWLKDGDASTSLFHAVANGRCTRNYIPALKDQGELITEQSAEEKLFFDAYSSLIGEIRNRDHTLDLEELGMQSHVEELRELGNLFSEAEIWEVIKELPPERAPGPDGIVGAFYQRAWPTIKPQILAAITKLSVGDGRTFGKLNRAIITLIPKKPDTEDVGDFRPISLVHSFAKIFTKLMANRLHPKMERLVSKNQSVFIKARLLHDNFILVRQMVRKIHSRGEPGVLLKLDISRAFDSLSWAFLFEILRKLGFPEMWIQWTAISLRIASTRISVNGSLGAKICHARGLRQGDPLSPQLFALAMEAITLMVCRAAEAGLLSTLGNCTQLQRVSIYTDDVVLFVKPSIQDLVTVKELLEVFGAASGLIINYNKTSATLIRGAIDDSERVASLLHCTISTFPIKYLGLQLSLGPLTRAQWQPVLDSATSIVSAWQKSLITRPGRLVLVKSVMAARLVHHLIIVDAPAWFLRGDRYEFAGISLGR
jgi:hypothetical protein